MSRPQNEGTTRLGSPYHNIDLTYGLDTSSMICYRNRVNRILREWIFMTSRFGAYVFAVVSLDPATSQVQAHISHYVFDNIDKANEFCAEQNADTEEKSVVILLRKMK